MTLGDLYQEFEDTLRAYAVHLARDSQTADDLVQEAFVRALGHLPLLQQLNRPQRRAWLCQTVKHLFLDRRNARLREEALLAQFAWETETVVLPAEAGIAADLLARLPEPDRRLLEQRYLLGMNSQEIAAELGIPAATVRSRLHLAIQKLRRHPPKWL